MEWQGFCNLEINQSALRAVKQSKPLNPMYHEKFISSDNAFCRFECSGKQ